MPFDKPPHPPTSEEIAAANALSAAIDRRMDVWRARCAPDAHALAGAAAPIPAPTSPEEA